MASRLTTFIVATIVVGTLIAGLIVGAQRDDATGPVDLIITNGRVYTGSSTEFAEAVAVRGNKVLLVGSNREIKRLRRPQTTMIDAHGGTVLPGFNDAHVDLIKGGSSLAALDLSEATTVPEIEARVKAFASARPAQPWITGRGWQYQPFPGAMSGRQRLDLLVADRPAFLVAHDRRTGWANSRALHLAGISRRTPNPPDGVIVKDPRTGEPTGMLKAGAMRLVEDVMPRPEREAVLEAARAAVEEAHKFGITSVQHVAGDVEDLDVISALRSSGELNVRVYAGLQVGAGFTEMDAEALEVVRATYPDDPVFKAGGVTLVVDSTDPAPFGPRGSRRAPALDSAELARMIGILDARGWQVLIRTADRRGVGIAIEALEQVAAVNPEPPRGRRHRIEHAGTLDDEDVTRLVSLGMVACQRPTQGSIGVADIDTWAASRLPDEVAAWPAFRRLQAAGGHVVFGSEWPLAILDPLAGLHAAVVEARAKSDDEAPANEEGAPPLVAAVDAYTANGAWSTFDEQRKGRLEREMLADIVILSTDIFRPGTRLLDAVVDTTIFDGRVVYSRPVPQETTD